MKLLQTTVALLCLLSLCNVYVTLAASGGIMGGDSFSSDSGSFSSGGSFDSMSMNGYYASSYRKQTSSTPTGPASGPASAPKEQDLISFFVIIVFLFLIMGCLCYCIIFGDLDNAQTSILKLQVGSLDAGRSLQRDLNRIAESADTSTSKGFNNVLQESIVSLRRHSEYCISGYSFVDAKRSLEECEKRFKQLSNEESGKFDEVTLVNVNNIVKKNETCQSSNTLTPSKEYSVVDIEKSLEEPLLSVSSIRKKNISQSSNGTRKEYIVVTIIVAARGVPELPPIKSDIELQKALQKLASIPSSNIMGVKVLWTPQKEDDSLTEQEMLEDYPLLHPL